MSSLRVFLKICWYWYTDLLIVYGKPAPLEQVSDVYTNFLWVDCLAEYNESILDKVIESEPEIIIFYFSDQPIISSIDMDAFSYTKCMDNYVWECVFEIGLDENYFCASFNSERFLAKKFISELERVIMWKNPADSGDDRIVRARAPEELQWGSENRGLADAIIHELMEKEFMRKTFKVLHQNGVIN